MSAVAGGPRPATTGLVGRDHEVDLLDAVLGGELGRVVVVEGEAGIGKTSLLDEVLRTACRRGARVATAGADDLLVEDAVGLLTRAIDQRTPGSAPLRLRWPPVPPGVDPSVALDQGGLPASIVDQLVDHFEAMSRGGPILVALDDLQWADTGTVVALPALARRTASLGVSFLLALRPAPRSTAIARALVTLERLGATTVELGPLASSDVDHLVAQMLDRPPTPQERHLVDGASGNPFLISEVLADAGAGTDGEAPTTEGDGVPARIRRLVSRRLDAEDEQLTRALTTAAILGRRVDLADLGRVKDLPASEVTQFARAAVDHGWLVEHDGVLQFRHDLVRDALIARTAAPVRRLIHRRAAEVAEARGPRRDVVAYHLARGLEPPDHASVVRIIELTQSLPRPTARSIVAEVRAGLAADDPDRPMVEVAHCHHLVWSNEPADGERAAREALGWITEPELVYELLACRSYALFQLGRPREAFESWEQSRRGAGAEITAFEHAQMSVAKLFAGDIDGARASAEIAVSDETTPRHGVRIARAVRAWIAATSGDHRTALDETGAALDDALAHPGEDRLPHDVPQLYRAVMLDAVGRGPEALDLLRRDFPATADLGSASVAVLRHSSAAMLLYRLGRWDEAQAEAVAGTELSRDMGVALGVGWLTGVQSLIALHRGDPERAATVLADQATDLKGPTLGMEWMAYAKASLDQVRGDHALALGTLQLTIDVAASSGMPVAVIFLGVDATRLAHDAGDDERADRLVAQIREMADRSAMPTTRAALDHVLALVRDDAEALGATATTIAGFPRPWEAGRCWHDAALAAARAGEVAQARAHAALALEQFDLVGANGSTDRMRSELRELGVRIRRRGAATVGASEAGEWDRLTAMESTVTALAGEGLSNKQMADRLFISRRTVESHLGRVYQKLGISTRAALVAAAAARSPEDD